MRRWYIVVVTVMAMVVLLAGCGSTDTPSSSAGPAASASVTTTSAPDTTTSAAAPSTDAPNDLASYKARMKQWFDKYNADLLAGATAMGDIQDPMKASDQDIQAAQDYADLMARAADDLESIQPPAEASSAHSTYLESLRGIALGASQFMQAIKDKSPSTLNDASATLSGAVEKGTPARDSLETTLGFPLSGDAG